MPGAASPRHHETRLAANDGSKRDDRMNMALLLILILFGMAGAVALTTAAAIACVLRFLAQTFLASTAI